MAVDKCDDMRVVQPFQDIDFGRKVVLEFLVEFRQVNRLYGNVGASFLAGDK
jgi:hypothetical protein